ncbi:GyrI-like domain-containing protein [Paenibacillus filicis]|uniref:GyrI-like domain-containing protein n=1 Tax=Paenibacillus gyeongsangnamensis TaxID=3388067 RepID=A0ABT4QCL8_9BACL|nr:GyrI-like domain-containing protein [Paenibacillus filicis]MCZ8514420.1 GyrI-like domain-containing protein [Paenibacillus filicis]
MEWLVRMKDALELMESRMDEQLDIEDIAKAAYSSPFHFQRMFHMLTGVTVAEYIRKRRLTLAAQELAVSPVRVLDVALKYGYDTPEAFSKAFRKVHGITPSAAREPGARLKAFPRISFHLSLKGDKEMDYRIVEKGPFTVVGKSIQLSTRDGENTRRIPQFWAECHQDGTVGRLSSIAPDKELLGICTDMQHDKEQFTYLIAVEAGAGAAEEGLISRSIPAASWAVFPSVGPLPGAIQSVWARIYQEWFPATGYEHGEGPELEVYPLGDIASEDYRCEVWVPVVKR